LTWYSSTPDRITEQLDTDLELGLSEQEAAARLQTYGPN